MILLHLTHSVPLDIYADSIKWSKCTVGALFLIWGALLSVNAEAFLNPVAQQPKFPQANELLEAEKRDERKRFRNLVHVALQKELSTVGRAIDFKQEDALKLLRLVEDEWIGKLVDPLFNNTFRNRTPVREAHLESAMLTWLGNCVDPDDVARYSTEVELRSLFRIQVLQEELLDLIQKRFALTEKQLDEFHKRLVSMQPNADHELAIRQLTESAQHRLVAPLINEAYSEGRISNYQRNAVARFEHGTVQATYPTINYESDTSQEFYLNDITLRGNTNLKKPRLLPSASPAGQQLVAEELGVGDAWKKVRRMRELANRAQAEGIASSIHGQLSKVELEEMLFGVVGGSRQAFQVRRKDDILRQVDRIHRICNLTDEQKEKIDQAIEIEIERNFSEIASLLSEIDDSSVPQLKSAVYKSAHQMLTQMQQEKYFEQESLWEKIVHSVVDETQNAKLKDEDARAENRRQNLAKDKVVLYCQQAFGLTELERQQIRKFLHMPRNENLNNIDATREALSKLSVEKRRDVMPDPLWEQWK